MEAIENEVARLKEKIKQNKKEIKKAQVEIYRLYEQQAQKQVREEGRKCSICGKIMIPHIWRGNDWKFHIHSWDTLGIHCSEKDCEDNHGKGKCDGTKPQEYPSPDAMYE